MPTYNTGSNSNLDSDGKCAACRGKAALNKWLVEGIRSPCPKSAGGSGASSFVRMWSSMGKGNGNSNESLWGRSVLAERLRDEYPAAINHPNVGIGGACLFRGFVQTYKEDILPTLASLAS